MVVRILGRFVGVSYSPDGNKVIPSYASKPIQSSEGKPIRLYKSQHTYTTFVTIVINKIQLLLINKILILHRILKDWHFPVNVLE